MVTRGITIGLMAMLLSNCAFIKAATFQEHDNSELKPERSGKGYVRLQGASGIVGEPQKICDSTQRDVKFAGPGTITIVSALFGLAYGEASAALSAYVNEKKKNFQASTVSEVVKLEKMPAKKETRTNVMVLHHAVPETQTMVAAESAGGALPEGAILCIYAGRTADAEDWGNSNMMTAFSAKREKFGGVPVIKIAPVGALLKNAPVWADKDGKVKFVSMLTFQPS